MAMKRTQLYIEDELYQLLREEAAKDKRSVSGLVRELLRSQLAIRRMGEARRGGELLLRLASVAGEGPEDLSVRGEDYLVEELSR